MEVAILAAQQAITQTNTAIAAIKQRAKADEGLVNLVAQAVADGARGQKIDINV